MKLFENSLEKYEKSPRQIFQGDTVLFFREYLSDDIVSKPDRRTLRFMDMKPPGYETSEVFKTSEVSDSENFWSGTYTEMRRAVCQK